MFMKRSLIFIIKNLIRMTAFCWFVCSFFSIDCFADDSGAASSYRISAELSPDHSTDALMPDLFTGAMSYSVQI